MNYWDHTDARFRSRAADIERLPDSPEKAREFEDLLTLAQREFGFAEEYAARLSLLGSSLYVPRSADELTHYTWTRQALDSGHPMAETAAHTTVWKLKWALDRMTKSADVDRETLEAALVDFEGLLDRFGWNRRPAHQSRLALAAFSGQDAQVREELAAMTALPRDELADCEACENLGLAQALALHDPGAASQRLRPTIEGDLTCLEEPMQALALQTHLSLDAGETEAAARETSRGWRLARDRNFLAGANARYLSAFVRLGNVDRALDAALPRVAWLDDLSLDEDVMTFSAALSLVLRRAIEAGIAPEQVDGEPTAELADRLAESATTLANAFDARNGTTAVSERIRALLTTPAAAEPALPPLSMPDRPAAESAPESAPAPATRGRHAGGDEERPDAVAYGAALREAQATIAMDLTDLLDGWLVDRESLIANADGPDAWEAVARLDRACASLPGQDSASLLASAERAADLAGSEVQRRRARIAILLEEDRPDAVLEALALADELLARDEPREAAFALLAIGSTHGHAHARGATERAVALLRDHAPADLTLARAYLQQYSLQAADGELDAARASLDAAATVPGATEHWLIGRDLSASSARLALVEGDHESALRLLRESIAVPPRADERTTIWRRNLLASVLLEHSDWPALAEQGTALIGIAERAGDATLLAIGQRFLGIATAQSGDPYEGAALLEAALPVLARSDPGLAAQAAWALGHILSRLGETAAASATFAEASRHFESVDDLGATGEAQYRAGDLAWDADDLERAEAHHARATELAEQVGNLDLYLRARRDHAGVVATQGDVDAGLTELDGTLEAATRLAADHGETELDLEHLRSGILEQGANFMATAGDPAAAVVRQQSAVAAAEDEIERAGATCTLARFLAMAGQLDDSVRTLEPVIDTLTEEAPRALEQTLSVLCTALDEAGRTEEAESLWARRPTD